VLHVRTSHKLDRLLNIALKQPLTLLIGLLCGKFCACLTSSYQPAWRHQNTSLPWLRDVAMISDDVRYMCSHQPRTLLFVHFLIICDFVLYYVQCVVFSVILYYVICNKLLLTHLQPCSVLQSTVFYNTRQWSPDHSWAGSLQQTMCILHSSLNPPIWPVSTRKHLHSAFRSNGQKNISKPWHQHSTTWH